MTPNQLPPLQDVLAIAQRMKATAEDCSPHPRYSDSMVAFRTECIPANVIAVVDALAALAQQAQPLRVLERSQKRMVSSISDDQRATINAAYTTPPAPQVPAPDIDEAALARMTKRGAEAWAGVDAQALREGGQPAPVDELAEFKAELARMPEWEPDFKHHRAWVEPLLWSFWQARAALQSPAPQTKGQP